MATRRERTSSDSAQMELQGLPQWAEPQRGIPNAMARSALFCISNSRAGVRQFQKNRLVRSLAGITIRYTGEELRQDDEDVYLQILHICRTTSLGTMVKFTGYGLLVELGWDTSSKGYRRLVECLTRLTATALSITVDDPRSPDGRASYTGSLIRSFRWKETATDSPLREWEVWLEKDITNLFDANSYTRLEWNVRLRLKPMAKWLHSFYHTHHTPFPMKVDTLRELTGSRIKELRQFRYELRKALKELQENGFLAISNIDTRTDLVTVMRTTSLSHDATAQRLLA